MFDYQFYMRCVKHRADDDGGDENNNSNKGDDRHEVFIEYFY